MLRQTQNRVQMVYLEYLNVHCVTSVSHPILHCAWYEMMDGVGPPWAWCDRPRLQQGEFSRVELSVVESTWGTQGLTFVLRNIKTRRFEWEVRVYIAEGLIGSPWCIFWRTSFRSCKLIERSRHGSTVQVSTGGCDHFSVQCPPWSESMYMMTSNLQPWQSNCIEIMWIWYRMP